TRDILTNKEVIAIDQDPAGKEGYKLKDQGNQEVWVKPLADGDWAVLLLNRGNKSAFITLKIKNLNINKSDIYTVRDLWRHIQENRKDGLVRANVPSHGIKMYRIFAPK